MRLPIITGYQRPLTTALLLSLIALATSIRLPPINSNELRTMKELTDSSEPIGQQHDIATASATDKVGQGNFAFGPQRMFAFDGSDPAGYYYDGGVVMKRTAFADDGGGGRFARRFAFASPDVSLVPIVSLALPAEWDGGGMATQSGRMPPQRFAKFAFAKRSSQFAK